jgi:hypothetical protein
MEKLTHEQETALIKKLEASVPALAPGEHLYSQANTAYHIHVTEIKDAYWRRRMLTAAPGECAPG